MLKELLSLMWSDTLVQITEGDITNPTVIFTGKAYEVPASLLQRSIDCNGARLFNNTLAVHLIRG